MYNPMLSETATCIIAFAIQTTILAFFTYVSKDHKRKQNGLFITSFIVLWIFNVYNIVYTGILGWNMQATTPLEEFLDNITSAGFLTGMLMNFHARFREPYQSKKRVKER